MKTRTSQNLSSRCSCSQSLRSGLRAKNKFTSNKCAYITTNLRTIWSCTSMISGSTLKGNCQRRMVPLASCIHVIPTSTLQCPSSNQPQPPVWFQVMVEWLHSLTHISSRPMNSTKWTTFQVSFRNCLKMTTRLSGLKNRPKLSYKWSSSTPYSKAWDSRSRLMSRQTSKHMRRWWARVTEITFSRLS